MAIIEKDARSIDRKKLDSLLNLANNTHDDTTKMKIFQKLALGWQYYSFDLSEKYANKGLRIAEKYDDEYYKMFFYRFIGGIHQQKNEHDSALYFYNKSLALAKKLNIESDIAKTAANIGSIYLFTNQYDKAEKIYLKYLDFFMKKGDTIAVSQTYNNLGLLYLYEREYEKAKSYFKKTIALSDSGDVHYALRVSNLAEAYFYSGQLDSALYLYNLVLRIFRDLNTPFYEGYTYMLLGDFYSEQNNYGKAISYYKKSIEKFKKVHTYNHLAKVYKRLIDAFKKSKDYKSATTYYDKYLEIKDSLNTEKREKLLEELQIKYDIKLLDSELKNKNKQLAIKNTFLIILGIISSILFLLLVLVWILYKNTQRASKSLATHNIDLAKKEETISKLKQKIGPDYIEDDDETEISPLLKKIIKLLEEDKVYLDPELSIIKFAQMLGTNKTYVSNEINRYFKKNFRTLLNEYRVAEARRLLLNPKYENYTFSAIAEKAGFNSVSVFNRAFKSVTGITPSYYLKELKNKSENPVIDEDDDE